MENIQTFTTAREVSNYLLTLGLPQSAVEALVKETAAGRHEWRTEQARLRAQEYLATAPSYSEGILVKEVGVSNALELNMALLCLAELAGIGGTDGVEGRGTSRHPAFARLGKGRKQASDGGAYTAAVYAACVSCAPLGEDITLRPSPGEKTEGIRHLSVFIGGEESLYSLDETPEWGLTLAREGLRRAAGLAPWHQLPCVFAGTLQEWGEAVATYTTYCERKMQWAEWWRQALDADPSLDRYKVMYRLQLQQLDAVMRVFLASDFYSLKPL